LGEDAQAMGAYAFFDEKITKVFYDFFRQEARDPYLELWCFIPLSTIRHKGMGEPRRLVPKTCRIH